MSDDLQEYTREVVKQLFELQPDGYGPRVDAISRIVEQALAEAYNRGLERAADVAGEYGSETPAGLFHVPLPSKAISAEAFREKYHTDSLVKAILGVAYHV